MGLGSHPIAIYVAVAAAFACVGEPRVKNWWRRRSVRRDQPTPTQATILNNDPGGKALFLGLNGTEFE
jgi:hypothetical protein